MSLQIWFEKVQKRAAEKSTDRYNLAPSPTAELGEYEVLIREELEKVPADFKTRLEDEFFNWGPLQKIVSDKEVNEILVNGPSSIWIERRGRLSAWEDEFLSAVTFRNILDRISHQAGINPTAEGPIVDGHLGPFRINFVRAGIHPGNDILSLRRHPDNPWTLEALHQNNWCESSDLELIRHWIQQEKNFLVIGPTSSGKTSILSACLNEIEKTSRALVLEDSSEIHLPNPLSLKLLTRKDAQGLLPEVGLLDLLKTALRLRPDRLVVGEMRGPEAKDFLMALSSGHRGSLGTLHAEDPHQALLRLEMLVQLGAPQWSLQAIRRLIQLSLDGILVTGRNSAGQRKFKGFYSISSLEESGLTLEKLESFTLSAKSSEREEPLSLATL